MDLRQAKLSNYLSTFHYTGVNHSTKTFIEFKQNMISFKGSSNSLNHLAQISLIMYTESLISKDCYNDILLVNIFFDSQTLPDYINFNEIDEYFGYFDNFLWYIQTAAITNLLRFLNSIIAVGLVMYAYAHTFYHLKQKDILWYITLNK